MNCGYKKEELALLFTDSLDDQRRQALEEHLASCPDCRMEFQEIQKTWNLMGSMPKPQPPASMRSGFDAMMDRFKKENAGQKGFSYGFRFRIQELWRIQPQFPFALGFLLIILGFGGGYLLNHSGKGELAYARQVDSLSSQVSEMKQMMMLSLLDNPSASQRIRAISYTEDIGNVNLKVINALFTTLNEDPNVNVRLMTLDALISMVNDHRVREGLVNSISLLESSIVQSAIADAMVKLQEKNSVKSLRELLLKKDLNEMVKIKIEQSIHKLI